MHYYYLIISLLLGFVLSSTGYAATQRNIVTGGVVLQRKTVTLIRSGRLAKDFPERRKAKISFPVVKSGISDPAILAKVRSLLKLKNIFDTSLQEYREDAWLIEFDYKVNYNKNFILDITFMQEGVGAYPDSQEKHLAINLRTGELIRAADVFKPGSLGDLARLVDNKLRRELQETIEQVNQDPSLDAEAKQSFPDLYRDLKIEVKDLDNFSIDEKGITFLYDAGFPHVIQAYQPAGVYRFSYAELSQFLKREGAPQSLTR